jgi:RecA-family ATPase
MQIVEALAIVTGKPLLGEPVIEQCNVWIINLEDPIEELQSVACWLR